MGRWGTRPRRPQEGIPIRRRTAHGLALVTGLSLLAACTGASDDEQASPPEGGEDGGDGRVRAVLRAQDTPTTVLPVDSPADAAAALSAHLLASSPSVVIGEEDPATLDLAAALAATDGVPLLLPAPSTTAEVRRLGAGEVLTVGARATTWAEQTFTGPDDPPVRAHETSGPVAAPDPGEDGGTTLLVTGAGWEAAAAATARALGVQVLTVPGADPRAGATTVDALHAGAGRTGSGAGRHVVGLGSAFGPPEVFASRTAVASTGIHVPGGGQLPLAGRRAVALYGTPGTPSLGVLGEQSLPQTLDRARALAARYDGLGGLPAVPTLEIITTVAAGSPGSDGDYSTELDPDDLEPWVDRAGREGVAVVLDLQSGRSDFLTQARRYEQLLRYPHVGLALDPEWRLGPDQRPLQQIGSVDVAEVNAVADWLAGFVRDRTLPQKVFLLHQFRTSMVRDREELDVGHDELVTVVHADGHGTPGNKEATYRALTRQGPAGLLWGWKNFLDEDTPTFTPQQTAALEPPPVFVSYQ
ncbi:hypothetical protein AB2L28_17190 [Kineococcus sp. TBRC 1896]|uniref:Lipoprotein n=1 Tax=Kineococcus mangrovi TaxID=1660183 RepID=A0ABV4I5K2_9ACTN